MQQNNQFSPRLAQFAMKGPTGWNKGEVGKRKGKKDWGAIQYRRDYPDQRRETIRKPNQILIFTWKSKLKNQSNIIFKWRAFWVNWIILIQMLCNSVQFEIRTWRNSLTGSANWILFPGSWWVVFGFKQKQTPNQVKNYIGKWKRYYRRGQFGAS